MMLPNLIVIEGTNASGKSALAVTLAEKWNGEIVSADSRQVYRGLDLGSGKITPEETRGVPHHLIDIRDPGEFFSMAEFQRLAFEAIDDILSRGKLPFLAGGTGLYVDAVADGYLLTDKVPDLSYRAELEKLSTPELYAALQKALPGYQVDEKNRNRVMRVLEKLHDGDSVTAPGREKRYDTLRLGVTWEREELKKRIDERLDRRFAQGMTEEVRRLLYAGVSKEFLLGLGLEYRCITQYLTGEFSDFEEMREQLSLAIKRFARRQMTWFRRDSSVHWLDMRADPAAQADALIAAFLKERNGA